MRKLVTAPKCGHLTKKGRSYCKGCTPYRRDAVRCVVCQKTMSLSPSVVKKKKTCSVECRRKYASIRQLGPLSSRWRGGKTSADRVSRNSAKYDQWRRDVFARDAYRCQLCGYVGNRLVADHLLPWANFPEFRFDLSNGRALCRPCHAALPTSGGAMLSLRALSGSNRLEQAWLCWYLKPQYYAQAGVLAASLA